MTTNGYNLRQWLFKNKKAFRNIRQDSPPLNREDEGEISDRINQFQEITAETLSNLMGLKQRPSHQKLEGILPMANDGKLPPIEREVGGSSISRGSMLRTWLTENKTSFKKLKEKQQQQAFRHWSDNDDWSEYDSGLPDWPDSAALVYAKHTRGFEKKMSMDSLPRFPDVVTDNNNYGGSKSSSGTSWKFGSQSSLGVLDRYSLSPRHLPGSVRSDRHHHHHQGNNGKEETNSPMTRTKHRARFVVTKKHSKLKHLIRNKWMTKESDNDHDVPLERLTGGRGASSGSTGKRLGRDDGKTDGYVSKALQSLHQKEYLTENNNAFNVVKKPAGELEDELPDERSVKVLKSLKRQEVQVKPKPKTLLAGMNHNHIKERVDGPRPEEVVEQLDTKKKKNAKKRKVKPDKIPEIPREVKEEFFKEIQQKQKNEQLTKDEVGDMLTRYISKWKITSQGKKQEAEAKDTELQEQVTVMVNSSNKDREQIQNLRQAEQRKLNDKLQQKLMAKKGQVNGVEPGCLDRNGAEPETLDRKEVEPGTLDRKEAEPGSTDGL